MLSRHASSVLRRGRPVFSPTCRRQQCAPNAPERYVGDGHLAAHASGLKQYRAFLLDMDGVLHQFGKAVPGAKEFLQMLIDEPIPFMVITNECRYTSSALSLQLADVLGVTVPKKQIYTAANSCRDFFRYNIKRGWEGNIYVIGEEGLVKNIEAAVKGTGSRVVTAANMLEDEELHCDFVCIGTVVTGGANDSWVNAERASTFLNNGGKLVYSSPDLFEVTSQGEYKFGCAMPVVNLLSQVTGCKPYNLGKPNPFMLRAAHKQLVDAILGTLSKSQRSFVQGQINSQDVLFVGDSVDTDLRTAIENGIDAAMVLSGTASTASLSRSALRPNFVFDDIKDLHVAFQNGALLKGSTNYTLKNGVYKHG